MAVPRNILNEELNAAECIEDILQKKPEENCLDYEFFVILENLPVSAEILPSKALSEPEDLLGQ